MSKKIYSPPNTPFIQFFSNTILYDKYDTQWTSSDPWSEWLTIGQERISFCISGRRLDSGVNCMDVGLYFTDDIYDIDDVDPSSKHSVGYTVVGPISMNDYTEATEIMEEIFNDAKDEEDLYAIYRTFRKLYFTKR